MIKYLAASAALNIASLTPSLYRYFANFLKSRIARHLPPDYINRGHHLLRMLERYDVIREGDSLLELGTGTTHWESLFIRLSNNVNITLYDVVDNRLFRIFKTYLSELSRYQEVPASVLRVESFEDLYRLLGMEYVLLKSGSLSKFKDNAFRCLYSYHVFEHIQKEILCGYVKDTFRILEPGGYSIHNIDLCDHYYYYDKTTHPKQYLKYSERAWRLLGSAVHYINRVQYPEWMELFNDAGFELIEDEVTRIPLDGLHVSERYCDVDGLECSNLVVVHRRPL